MSRNGSWLLCNGSGGGADGNDGDGGDDGDGRDDGVFFHVLMNMLWQKLLACAGGLGIVITLLLAARATIWCTAGKA